MEYAVIMAGGIGSRFWPRSRQAEPKQFLRVFNDSSLIQNTVDRLEGFIPPERCLIVTNERYIEKTRKQLPQIPAENILAEPVSRNTGPCIAYAAARLYTKDPKATMIVLPADHLIRDVNEFHRVLQTAADEAHRSGTLGTIGIKPTHPATGYGYIQYDDSDGADTDDLRAYPVTTFAEKPDAATAERFLDSGDFLWNSGMFIWQAEAILEQIEVHQPEIHALFEPVIEAVGTADEEEAVAHAFQNVPRISIDYGVMEEADRVFVVPGSFGWSDVGDWQAVYMLREKDDLGNAIEGNVILQDSSRNLVDADDRLVVLVGVHDKVVVDTDDAVLICNRENAQQVKKIVEYLQSRQLNEYL
jgi:mannose-1-phosphate guanylyltransferase